MQSGVQKGGVSNFKGGVQKGVQRGASTFKGGRKKSRSLRASEIRTLLKTPEYSLEIPES